MDFRRLLVCRWPAEAGLNMPEGFGHICEFCDWIREYSCRAKCFLPPLDPALSGSSSYLFIPTWHSFDLEIYNASASV